MSQESISSTLTNISIVVKTTCFVTLTAMISAFFGYGIKTIKKIDNEVMPNVSSMTGNVSRITEQLARDDVGDTLSQHSPSILECIRGVNQLISSVNSMAQNVNHITEQLAMNNMEGTSSQYSPSILECISRINNFLSNATMVANNMSCIIGQPAGNSMENMSLLECVEKLNNVLEDVSTVVGGVAENMKGGKSLMGSIFFGIPNGPDYQNVDISDDDGICDNNSTSSKNGCTIF